MRVFHLLKLLQVIIASVVVASILSTSKLCTNFVSNEVLQQHLINSSCTDFAIKIETFRQLSTDFGALVEVKEGNPPANSLNRFFSNVLHAWDSVFGYNDHLEANQSLTSSAPTTMSPSVNIKKNWEEKDRIMGFQQCIQISMSDYFAFAKSESSPVSSVLRRFTAPLVVTLSYILLNIAHTVCYGSKICKILAYFIVIISAVMWFFIFSAMVAIDYNWDLAWHYTDVIQPQSISAIFIVKILSIILIVAIIIECDYDILSREIVLRRPSGRYNVSNNINSYNVSLNGNTDYEWFLPTTNRMILNETNTVSTGFDAASSQHPQNGPVRLYW
ncbi:hypothetical protein DdX_05181 [Ditylenchus destructor]|uniref:Uncharacterized protein n=1 Tax=Ditylenchus destructor TaxID=166010 RepID=A0AAD4NE92_9BILA|nr:hypothetical protein DdX_05181 [Ditylenchus destructor]